MNGETPSSAAVAERHDAMIARPALLKSLELAVRRNGATALLGPRRCGKTTLARQFARLHGATVFDLADPGTSDAFEHPRRVLDPIRGCVVIDGIERRHEVLVAVRSIADGPMRMVPRRSTKFLIVGGVSREILRTGTDALTDLATVETAGFLLAEHAVEAADVLWVRGGLPGSLLAETDEASFAWRAGFTTDFVERDGFVLGSRLSPTTMRRLWTMVAHRHAKPWNSSEVGRSLGADDWTARRYLDRLAGDYLVRVLPARVENVKKRQRHAPNSAMTTLRLEKSWVIYPGEQAYDLARNVRAVPIAALGEEFAPIARGLERER